MATSANYPAFPVVEGKYYDASDGLTTREYMATQIAAGLADSAGLPKQIAIRAIAIADALIEELNGKDPTKTPF